MAEQTYAEKLKDPRWQKLRLLVFQRDMFKCTNCGDGKRSLQVHHIDYEPGYEPWEYPIEFLKTLCEKCHADEKFRKREEKGLLLALRMAGFHVTTLTKMKTLLYFKQFSEWLESEIIKTQKPNG